VSAAAGGPPARPFRFALQMPHLGARASAPVFAAARRAEALGYGTISMPDHFVPQLAVYPTLAAVAQVAPTVRLGTAMIAADFRHPAVLAKDVATVDVLSDGRVELGIGAGWARDEYAAAGFTWSSPGERIARLAEVIAIVKGLWGPDPVTFHGEHFTIEGLEGHPKPVQQPRPPICIGGGGRKILALAAREADIVGINVSMATGRIADSGASALEGEMDARVAWVREVAGPERFSQLELTVRVTAVAVLPDGTSAADRRARAEDAGRPTGLSGEQALQAPTVLVGTVDEICADLVARRERYGFSYVCVSQGAMEDFAPVVERLAGT
jgi:probable F420-dependent oxidoreductase